MSSSQALPRITLWPIAAFPAMRAIVCTLSMCGLISIARISRHRTPRNR